MKKVKLFVASSSNSLYRDKIELGAFVDDLNDHFEQAGVYFQLIMDDDVEPEAAKAEAEESELFYVIFFDEAETGVIDKFNAAFDSFRRKGKPKISTYFKTLGGGEPERSVLDFMKRLDSELGHYYSNYAHVDTIKLNVALQAKLLGLPSTSVETGNSALNVGGQKLIKLENIPLLSNNRQLAKMKAEHAEAEKDFLRLREAHHANPDDENALAAYFWASERKKTASDSIERLQREIVEMETSFLEKANAGGVTPRQRAARKCLENGDIEGAKLALDADVLKSEQESAVAMFEVNKKKQRLLVNEWLQRAQILQLDISNPERFAGIEEAYTQAIALEKDCGLERTTDGVYAYYLYDQNNITEAINHAEAYLNYLLSEGAQDVPLYAIYTLLGDAYKKNDRYDEAEEHYQKAVEVAWKLAGDEPKAYTVYLARSCRSLGGLYSALRRFPNPYAKQADELWIKLANENPIYEFEYAANYGCMAFIWGDPEHYDEIETIYKRQIKKLEELSAQEPSVYSAQLASLYESMTIMLGSIKRFIEAEHFGTKALAIRKRLADENPAGNETDLAQGIEILARLYESMNRIDETEEQYMEALEIRKRLALINPALYERDLAKSACELADLYKTTGNPKEEEQLRIALPIFQRLAEIAPSRYGFDYKSVSSRLMNFCEAAEKYDELEELHKGSMKIFERAADESRDEMNIDALSRELYSFAMFYMARKRFDEAEKLYKRMRRQLEGYIDEAIENRSNASDGGDSGIAESMRNSRTASAYDRCVSRLSDVYRSLAEIYSKKDRPNDAEKIRRQAIGVWERFADEEGGRFEAFLAVEYMELARLCEKKGSDEAEKLYKQALSYKEKLEAQGFSNAFLDYDRAYDSLAGIYMIAKRYDDAEGLYREIIPVQERLSEENPKRHEWRLGKLYCKAADLYINGKRYGEAMELYAKALDIEERQTAGRGANWKMALAHILNYMSRIHAVTGEDDKAAEAFGRALDIWEQTSGYPKITEMLPQARKKLASLREKAVNAKSEKGE